jgi:hypothetical protein
MSILTTITAIFGVALGSASLVLGIINHLRDRHKIKIHLQWHLEMRDSSFQRIEGECGMITVTNTGRRPVYISHVCLILPKKYKNRLLVVKKSIEGQKLSEGDPPARFVVPLETQNKYSKDLGKIRAQVSDSTGKTYLSKFPKMQQTCQPSETG